MKYKWLFWIPLIGFGYGVIQGVRMLQGKESIFDTISICLVFLNATIHCIGLWYLIG